MRIVLPPLQATQPSTVSGQRQDHATQELANVAIRCAIGIVAVTRVACPLDSMCSVPFSWRKRSRIPLIPLEDSKIRLRSCSGDVL